MNTQEELDLYRGRYHQIMALLESGYLIIEKIGDDNKELTVEEVESWKEQTQEFGIGDKEPKQVHRKDYFKNE